ncbi:MAG: hypothetical protein BGO28_01730 [Alphaproteobacteria bacterium 43-37]|nr:MAG: hypothetical protein BGO28_01730 [Alphaproteobacteria bacterium 43-37]
MFFPCHFRFFPVVLAPFPVVLAPFPVIFARSLSPSRKRGAIKSLGSRIKCGKDTIFLVTLAKAGAIKLLGPGSQVREDKKEGCGKGKER